METQTNLIGAKVRINIQEPEGYTNDLYSSIQRQEGVIIEKTGELSSYKDGWLVQFGKKATAKYGKTHSGKWGGQKHRDNMSWWIERKDFTII